MEDRQFPSQGQDLISDSYPHSHKALSVWAEGPKIYNIFKKSNVKFEK